MESHNTEIIPFCAEFKYIPSVFVFFFHKYVSKQRDIATGNVMLLTLPLAKAEHQLDLRDGAGLELCIQGPLQ